MMLCIIISIRTGGATFYKGINCTSAPLQIWSQATIQWFNRYTLIRVYLLNCLSDNQCQTFKAVPLPSLDLIKTGILRMNANHALH